MDLDLAEKCLNYHLATAESMAVPVSQDLPLTIMSICPHNNNAV